MSAEKKVITIKGEELPISQCRKFNKLFYKIGDVNIKDSGDCYLIDDKYCRFDTGMIVYNHSINKYVINNNSLISGIVGIEEGKFIIGSFNSDTRYSVLYDKQDNAFNLFNPKIIENNREYRERMSTGDFYHISRLNAKRLSAIEFPKKDYKYSLPYDSKGILDTYLEKYNNNYNPEILQNIENYAPLLKDLTFGLEFETTKGIIPNRILDNYGLIPLRDGSISGIEYVTVPMEGKKGLQCTYDILESLNKRTMFDDKTCSLHLHLGNVPRTKEFILAFLKIALSIQDEMFSMFPIYKKYNFEIKNKNYTAPLPTYEILSQLDPIITSSNIDKNFNVIYRYLAMGQPFEDVDNDLNNVKSHPADPNSHQKWNVRTRYHLFNLIPLLFGNKQTIEFRIHTPTYEINKILPFILMNSILVNFTIDNQSKILTNEMSLNNFNIQSIISNYLHNFSIPNKRDFLNMMDDYIYLRKNYSFRQTRDGNVLGDENKIPHTKLIDWSLKKSKINFKPESSKPSIKNYYDNNIDDYHSFMDTMKKEMQFKVKELTIQESKHKLNSMDLSGLEYLWKTFEKPKVDSEPVDNIKVYNPNPF